MYLTNLQNKTKHSNAAALTAKSERTSDTYVIIIVCCVPHFISLLLWKGSVDDLKEDTVSR